ncbi:hypothetical protein U1Q18_008220 [Sarracenia purpurea var. burkii]
MLVQILGKESHPSLQENLLHNTQRFDVTRYFLIQWFIFSRGNPTVQHEIHRGENPLPFIEPEEQKNITHHASICQHTSGPPSLTAGPLPTKRHPQSQRHLTGPRRPQQHHHARPPVPSSTLLNQALRIPNVVAVRR